ncbi:MAG: Uma2 family endonuclease [Saprospiraceae bacterium]
MSAIHPAQRQPDAFSGITFPMPNSDMSDEQFYKFCLLNHELRIERTPDKHIIIMPPTNSETGRQNFNLSVEFGIWNKKHKLGEGFDSSTGFHFPTIGDRSPDFAWIRAERWAAVPEGERKRFAPIVPDFVVEIRSGDQNIRILRDKMEDYIADGCRLGWLIDPENRQTHVYAENGDIHTLGFDQALSGGDVLPGFELRLADIWD